MKSADTLRIDGKVVSVSPDSFSVVINKGDRDGVKKGMRFLIYKLGEELFDPDTCESLGRLEVICGEGRVTHVQEKMSTIMSSEIEVKHCKRIQRPVNSFIFSQFQEIDEPEEIKKPFNDASALCYARSLIA